MRGFIRCCLLPSTSICVHAWPLPWLFLTVKCCGISHCFFFPTKEAPHPTPPHPECVFRPQYFCCHRFPFLKVTAEDFPKWNRALLMSPQRAKDWWARLSIRLLCLGLPLPPFLVHIKSCSHRFGLRSSQERRCLVKIICPKTRENCWSLATLLQCIFATSCWSQKVCTPALEKFRWVLGFLRDVYLTENCKYTKNGRPLLKATGNIGIVSFRI